MSTLDPAAPPSRQARTILWMAGLLVGTCAHITWWTTIGPGKCEAPPAAPTEVHIHIDRAHEPRLAADADHRRAQRERRRHDARSRHRHHRRAHELQAIASMAPNGAVICTTEGCTVRRSFVQRLIDDPAVRPNLRAVPHVEDGQFTGLRLFGVRDGSVAALLGLHDGDTLVALDDTPFRDGPALVAKASALPQADNFTLTLLRGGDTLHLRYELVDG